MPSTVKRQKQAFREGMKTRKKDMAAHMQLAREIKALEELIGRKSHLYARGGQQETKEQKESREKLEQEAKLELSRKKTKKEELSLKSMRELEHKAGMPWHESDRVIVVCMGRNKQGELEYELRAGPRGFKALTSLPHPCSLEQLADELRYLSLIGEYGGELVVEEDGKKRESRHVLGLSNEAHVSVDGQPLRDEISTKASRHIKVGRKTLAVHELPPRSQYKHAGVCCVANSPLGYQDQISNAKLVFSEYTSPTLGNQMRRAWLVATKDIEPYEPILWYYHDSGKATHG